MRHEPVLKREVIEFLALEPGMKVVDGTLGDAGHSEIMLEKISPNGKLLGIDMDPEAILRAKQFLYRFEGSVIFARDNFVNLAEIVNKEGFTPVDAILLDLGWSTPQFEERGRGFSFQKDESLDMRLSGDSSMEGTTKTAADILNEASFEELNRTFWEYGEEKFSKEIAKKVLEYREKEKIVTTIQLVDIVTEVYKKKGVRQKIHPATRVFQALRIAVNNELGNLKLVLPQAVEILKPGGRLAVISFHSLEDRIAKHFFKGNEDKLKILTKKPVIAGEEEIKENPKARSAKLRVAERV